MQILILQLVSRVVYSTSYQCIFTTHNHILFAHSVQIIIRYPDPLLANPVGKLQHLKPCADAEIVAPVSQHIENFFSLQKRKAHAHPQRREINVLPGADYSLLPLPICYATVLTLFNFCKYLPSW